MSAHSSEPMWYCHECNAEMRPLMIPDPHCASCQGTFVEKMENPADDPRGFHNAEPDLRDVFGPLGMIASFNELLRETAAEGRRERETPQARSPSPRRRREIHVEFGPPTNRRRLVVGGPNVLGRRESGPNIHGPTAGHGGSSPPRFSDFLRANGEASGASEPRDMNIPGQLMAQYMMAMLGGATLGGPRGMSPFFGPPGMDDEHESGHGRWGDYIFTQEALDQLMTQLMEGANSTRPVPAPEDIVEKLPREVLEEGNPLLEKDCAVCKEQFSTKADDPDEQVVVTLPCKHPFHEGCIVPWLKSSGTCPVCRYALVPQPNAHPSEPGPSSDGQPPLDRSGSSSSPGTDGGASSSGPALATGNNGSSGNTSSGNNTSSRGGFFSNLFGHRRNGSGGSSSRSSHSTSPARDRQQGRSSGSSNNNIPGAWGDTD